MTSRFSYRSRWAVVAVAAAAIAIAGPAGAQAATPVGATIGDPTLCPAGALFLQTTSPGNAYAAPTAGVLTSWSFHASSSPPQVKLLVARATGTPNQYAIVGDSPEQTPAPGAGVTTYGGISIDVQQGDILGVRLATAGDCISASGRSGYVSRGITANPAVGGSVTFVSSDDRQVDISATLEPDADGDGLGDETEDADDDGDTVADGADNCAAAANTDQADLDGDDQGDACDADDDGDTVADGADNCAAVANTDQADLDGDAQGDACDTDDDADAIADTGDNCATVANADQANLDGDPAGDACDADRDGDGVPNTADNCPGLGNATQANADGDALGDACDPTPRPVTPPPPPPAADTTAPVLSTLALAPKRFTASAGSEVGLAVDEAGTVRFTVQRRTTGRKVGGKCKAQTRANRARKACTRWVRAKGSLSVNVMAGETSVAFFGRVGGKTLKPGRYRLSARATDAAGNVSLTRRAAFRIRR
jgi:hypothetical protein